MHFIQKHNNNFLVTTMSEGVDATKLSIKELKQIILDAKQSIPSGIEKPELIALAIKALHTPKVYFPVCKEQGCAVEKCRAVFLFFHGYGADEHQFDFFLGHHPEIALITPKSSSEGWWPLNVMEWAMAMQQPAVLMQKVQETPVGLVEARTKAVAFCQQLMKRAPQGARLLIGGFSQGGVMAIDLALSLPPTMLARPVYLAAFSSFPVNLGYWQERAKVANYRALVTHGKTDPVVPYMSASIICETLKPNVEFCAHNGAHTLGDAAVLAKCKQFFDEALQ